MLGLVFTLLECTFVVDLNCVYVFYETNYRSSPIWSFAITHTHDVHLRHEIGMHGFSPSPPHPTPPRLFPTAYSARYAGEWKKDLRYSTSHTVPFLYVQYGIFIRPASKLSTTTVFSPSNPKWFLYRTNLDLRRITVTSDTSLSWCFWSFDRSTDWLDGQSRPRRPCWATWSVRTTISCTPVRQSTYERKPNPTSQR